MFGSQARTPPLTALRIAETGFVTAAPFGAVETMATTADVSVQNTLAGAFDKFDTVTPFCDKGIPSSATPRSLIGATAIPSS